MHEQEILDTRGLKCPLPVLKARKRLKSMNYGEKLYVHADDPMAVVDFPHFCTEQGYELLEQSGSAEGGNIFVIRK